MSHEIKATDFNDHSCKVHIDVLNPDNCPICHNKVDPKLIGSYLNGERDYSSRLNRIYRCTNRNCGNVFLAIYEGIRQGGNNYHPCWYFYRGVRPGQPKERVIPEQVEQLSSNFTEIYTQVKYAEDYGLKQICGVGYRKSLEYLVKDYLLTKIDSLPIDEEQLKNLNLYTCIQSFIDDDVTKEIAKRAVWLGNDETYYTRKWADKDIDGLKVLLNLFINAIENELLAQEYIGDMQ